MRRKSIWVPILFLAIALGVPSGVRADDGADGGGLAPGAGVPRTDALTRGLEVLHVRMQAKLGVADTLRAEGRLEEALQAYREVDAIYTQGITRLEAMLAGAAAPSPAVATGPTPSRPEKAPGDSVGLALAWLAAHQSPSGAWEAAGFDAWCRGEAQAQGPDGLGGPSYDVGVTGLALCAFLGVGYTDRGAPPFSQTVSRGLRYLKQVQDAEGCFGPRTSQHYVYNHAFASLAMVEAYGATGSPIFKGSARLAVDFILKAQNPYYGWRYGVRPGDNDTAVTTCMVLVLGSAKAIDDDARRRGQDAPFDIDPSAFRGALAWIDKMTDPGTGRVGYVSRGSPPARPMEAIDSHPADESEAMTAAGLLVRILAGAAKDTPQAVRAGTALLLAKPPRWSADGRTVDMMYWWFGTLATFDVGGDAWRGWSASLAAAVVQSQRHDTDACHYLGSWDPVGPWGRDGGRVFSTALMAMTAEAYYRYDRAALAGSR